MSISDILVHAASAYADGIAIVDRERRFTYAELAGRSGSLARALARRGLGRGDRIAILAPNSHEFAEAYFAAAALGAILVPLNTRLPARDVRRVLEDSGARALIAAPEYAALALEAAGGPGTAVEHALLVDDGGPDDYERALADAAGPYAPAPVGEDDVAHLYYTSGTTGEPKGVMLTHRNVCVHATWAIEELGLGARDVWGHFAPMFHLADAWATFAITEVGGRHVMCGRFDAGEALALIERHGITTSNLIPTMLVMMCARDDLAGRDLSSLRTILSGGAPIAPELVRRIVERLGCDYVQTYGMTETSPYLTVSLLHPHLEALPFEERLRIKARTGRPFGKVELAVVDDAGVPVPDDDRTVGEIRVRGPTVTPGYWNRPDATADAFAEGWLKTGDLAVVDAEGYVNIVDRRKDMILTGGENVYSTEVENALFEHPAVLEAAAFGLPDPTWGEIVAAGIVLAPGGRADATGIAEHCRARLAGYKVPRRVFFLDALPKTGSGKISKKELRTMFGGGRTGASE
ncbi:MAG: long-chain-fatty-acid--CoA ligase [Proteobacteria bacterium]|nr:long-chain-fatty-acid--CoA ligase [Pseudomonadota bacterium]